MAERAALEAAVAALQAQRALLGDAAIDLALAPLLQQLARLDPAAEPQRLRLVTVLFADVTGSTALARTLAPEDMHLIMDAALQAFTEVVRRHDGRVLQYAGDGLLAAFGADAVREDDAERAVRCGLALLARAAEERERVREGWAREGFGLRVGVHTGPVLLGGGVNDDGSIRGLTVHLAARMEQAAPHGALRISQETWRQVRGLFDADEQPPLTVKGQDEPMRTWLVRGARPAGALPERGVEGLAVPLVGRDAESAALQAAWRAVAGDGRWRALVIAGDSGIGKTRLMAEAARALPPGAPVWRARAAAQARAQPMGLWRLLLTQALGLAEDDGPAAARAAFEAAVLPRLLRSADARLAQAQAHVLGQVLGLDFAASPHLQGLADDGPQLRARAMHALRELVRSEAAPGRPLLLVLDDLHAADDDSLDFLAAWLRGPPELPLLLLLATRPTLAERRPGWPGAAPAIERLALGPLPGPEAGRLADLLLQRLPEPGPVRTMLVERAAGSPFGMEELLNMLIDAGAVQIDGAVWRLLPERLRATEVPGTLAGILQARLDALPPAGRRALQSASVLGPRFWVQALAAVDEQAPPELPELVARTLLADLGEPGDGLHAQAFATALLHQVAYDTLLRAQRQQGHARAAAWMQAQTGALVQAMAGVLGDHFERAGEAEAAAAAYARAAEQAAAQFAHASVINFADRVLALAPPQARALRWRAHLVRQRSLRLTGRLDEQWADLDALEALAADDPAERARILLRRAVALSEAGDLPATVRGTREALVLALASGADAVAISAHAALAGALRVLGPPEEALQVARAGLALARRAGPPSAVSEMLNVLAAAASEGGDHGGAEAMLAESLAIDQAGGSRFAEVTTLINLAECRTRLGRLDAAAEALDRAAPMAQALGMRNALVMATINRSNLERLRGDAEAAAGLAAAAGDGARVTGNREYEALAALALGQAELERGDTAAADAAFAAMLVLLEATGMTAVAAEPRAGRAWAALLAGDLGRARAWVDEVLADPAAEHGFAGCQRPDWIRQACASVLQALERS